MTDPRFHSRAGAFSLAQIAAACECALFDQSHGQMIVDDVAAHADAGPGHLAFLDNPKYRQAFMQSRAGACIVSAEMVSSAPKGMALLISANPYRSYALAAGLLYPPLSMEAGISPLAHIDPSATIGQGCRIEAGAVIGPGVVIGEGCWIGSHVTLTYCILGKSVRVHGGAQIGQDGFGFVLAPKGHVPVPQLGRVIIEDFVNIGANTTIDRGSGPDTVIGAGSVIDNLVQIAHNVKIGKGCVIAAQTGISGSTVLGDFVVCGGQVGIAGHLTIGSGARIAAQSGVTKDIPAGEEWVGFPAGPRRAYWKYQAGLRKLLSKTPLEE